MRMHCVPDWVLRQLVEQRLLPSSRRVYPALRLRCRMNSEGKGWCQATKGKLAEQAGIARKTVTAAIRDLGRHGLVERRTGPDIRSPAQGNIYLLPAKPPGVQESGAGGDVPPSSAAPTGDLEDGVNHSAEGNPRP